MTLDEFFANLKTIAPQFEWRLLWYGQIRAYNISGGEMYCPLTAYHYAVSGELVPGQEVVGAGLRSGLDYQDTWAVVAAADNGPQADQAISERLLTAIGVFV